MTPFGPRKQEGTIYFIGCTAPPSIKIGYTRGSAFSRARQLQTGSPVPLGVLATMPGTMLKESELHQRFREHRMEGEWFYPCDDLLCYIALACWIQVSGLLDRGEEPPQWMIDSILSIESLLGRELQDIVADINSNPDGQAAPQ